MNAIKKLGVGVALMLAFLFSFGGTAIARESQATHTSPVTHHMSAYTGYYYDADQATIAHDVEVSLHSDRTGHALLNPDKCRADGSCARAINYLESFQAHDPFGGWTLENMAQKIRALVRVCDGNFGNMQMDRIERATGHTDINGMHRTLNRGECVFVNAETHQPVLAEHCANPIGVRVDVNCVYVDFQAKDRREYAAIWARYVRPTDRCFAYRQTTRLYEPDSPRAVWTPVHTGCLRPCNMDADNRFFRENDVAHGQIPIDRPGTYQVRLEPGEKLLLCLKLQINPSRPREGANIASSFGNRVRWRFSDNGREATDYRPIGREQHARVYYESNDMTADGRHLNGPDGLSMYASTPEVEAQMQGITQPHGE